jgi:AAA15 family ATPase/GTPase
MIARLSVENYKSFNNKEEINMVSSSKIRSHKDHKVKIKQTSLLKYAVIYGANASGKSNLTDVFAFMRRCIEGGIPVDSFNDFCRIEKENKKRPSLFELQFTIGNHFYAYGFSVVLSTRKVTEEWLYELYQDGTAKELFEREEGQAPMLGSDIKATEAEKNRFQVYAEDFAGHDASLFLTEMNRGKKYDKKSHLLFFKDVFTYLRQNIITLNPNVGIYNFNYYYDEKSLGRINDLIQTFDTGISHVSIRKITMDELSNLIPEPILKQIIDDLRTRIRSSKSGNAQVSFRTPSNIINIRINAEGEQEITTLSMKHGSSVFNFDFKDESDGTRRIFDLIDMLIPSQDDIVYVVDELERSLHPKLTEHFLQLFMDAHQDQRVQLIFTTHEDSIMDQDLFRRDEIWFVERGADNASTIYSLDRFKERYDKKLSKAYLDGRYGAIPVFKKFSFKQEDD